MSIYIVPCLTGAFSILHSSVYSYSDTFAQKSQRLFLLTFNVGGILLAVSYVSVCNECSQFLMSMSLLPGVPLWQEDRGGREAQGVCCGKLGLPHYPQCLQGVYLCVCVCVCVSQITDTVLLLSPHTLNGH